MSNHIENDYNMIYQAEGGCVDGDKLVKGQVFHDAEGWIMIIKHAEYPSEPPQRP